MSQYKNPYKPIYNGMSYGFWTLLSYVGLLNDYQIVVTKKGEQHFTEGSSGKMWWNLVGEIWLCTWIAGTIEGAGDVGFFQSSQTDTHGTLFEALKFVGLMINDASTWKKTFLNRISEISRTKRRKRRKQNRRDAHRPPGLFSGVMLKREGR